MQLIAIRHGETEWNVAGREMGHLNSPLTPAGVSQGQAIARRLQRSRVHALYSSDLGRAVQTAEIIRSVIGLTPVLQPDLRERHMGVFQGLLLVEIPARFPDVYARYRSAGHFADIPEGESASARRERSVRAMTAIAEAHPDQSVVVVTHAGFLTGFLEHVLGLSPGSGSRFEKHNAAYNAFTYEQGGWRLETWNDIAHLVAEERRGRE
jgi:probable phosphoglycerate mutase